ncbi:hypothetical protein ACIPRI_14705 [Variovorax sp. LARHSF232]
MTRRKAIIHADELPPDPADWRTPPEPEPFVQRDGIQEELDRRRQQRDDPAAQRRAFNPYTFGRNS